MSSIVLRNWEIVILLRAYFYERLAIIPNRNLKVGTEYLVRENMFMPPGDTQLRPVVTLLDAIESRLPRSAYVREGVPNNRMPNRLARIKVKPEAILTPEQVCTALTVEVPEVNVIPVEYSGMPMDPEAAGPIKRMLSQIYETPPAGILDTAWMDTRVGPVGRIGMTYCVVSVSPTEGPLPHTVPRSFDRTIRDYIDPTLNSDRRPIGSPAIPDPIFPLGDVNAIG